MNNSNDASEIIKDVRQYLLSLKETGVEEVEINRETPENRVVQYKKDHNKAGTPAIVHTGGSSTETHPTGLTHGEISPGAEQLQLLRDKIGDCRRCKLCSGRSSIVFGTGNPDARLMFVGEGPGQEEDRQGKPFVGRAGELLTRMITAMGFSRDNIYIANVIKCRPPGNRNPEDDEIAACKPFLYEQIGIIKPEIVCALGTFAAQTLLDTKTRISDLRGRIHETGEYKIAATFHPAYLLRNPAEKRRAWEDLQLVMRELGIDI